MFDNMLNIVFFIAAASLVIFMVANAFGFGPGGPDADERQEAKTALAEEEAELIDVRTPREYDDNGLDGAKNIPLQQISNRLDEVGNRDEPVVLYCRSGNRSAQAADILEENGFDEIYDLGAHRTAKQVVEETR